VKNIASHVQRFLGEHPDAVEFYRNRAAVSLEIMVVEISRGSPIDAIETDWHPETVITAKFSIVRHDVEEIAAHRDWARIFPD
jgi:hypothetical protein